MRIGLLRRYEEIRRLRRIADVLIKHGFGYLVRRLGLSPHIPFRRRLLEPKPAEEPLPVRARQILEELGPTYVKFGQILSTRPDLIPKEYIVEFSKLLDEVPPFSFREVKEQIESELGKPLEELFASFEEKPFASASIAQVHVARLHSGEKVVVKVQRPGIEDIIEADIAILSSLASLLERHLPETRPYDPSGIVREFAKTIRRELDFTREGRNADKFRRNFEDIDYIYIPKVYWDLTGKRVLTLEYIEGVKIGDVKALESRGYDKKKIAENLAKSFLKQVYVDGFFQGDPHPANILVKEGGVIAFIDFGMIGRLDKELMNKLAELFIAIVKFDLERISQKYLEIGIITPETNISEFKLDVGELIEQYYGVPLKEIDMPRLLNDILDVAMEHRVRIPSNFSLLIKGMVTIEAVARQLDPDFNLSEVAEPFVRELVKRRAHPKVIASEFLKEVSNLGEAFLSIPRRLNQALEKFERGQITVEYRGFERLISQLDTTGNRISLALIISAITISSALVIQVERGPQIFGLPFLSVFGFLLAGFLGSILVLVILRSGRL
jgi:ubiquinone biosynthesis protein